MPFQVGADLDREALRARNPACSASEAPSRGGLLGGLLYLGCVLGVEVLLGDGNEADVCGLPDAEDQGVAAGRELLGRLARSRAGRARSRRRRRGRVRRARGSAWAMSVGASRSRLVVVVTPRRTRASSGGEYHAGLSPARKRSRSGRLRAGAAERVERHAERARRRRRARSRSRARSASPRRRCCRRSRRSARRSARP